MNGASGTGRRPPASTRHSRRATSMPGGSGPATPCTRSTTYPVTRASPAAMPGASAFWVKLVKAGGARIGTGWSLELGFRGVNASAMAAALGSIAERTLRPCAPGSSGLADDAQAALERWIERRVVLREQVHLVLRRRVRGSLHDQREQVPQPAVGQLTQLEALPGPAPGADLAKLAEILAARRRACRQRVTIRARLRLPVTQAHRRRLLAPPLAEAKLRAAPRTALGSRKLTVDASAPRRGPLDEAASRLEPLALQPSQTLLLEPSGGLLGDQLGDVRDVALRVGPAADLDPIE